MAEQPTKSVIKGRSSVLGAAAVVVLVTAIAAFAGIVTAYLSQTMRPPTERSTSSVRSEIMFDPNLVVRNVPTVIASLAGPTRAWIRLEFSVLLPNELARSDELAALIAQDTLAYVRSIPLDRIDNPLGLIFLREDIEERVQMRTRGKAQGVLFRTLVIE